MNSWDSWDFACSRRKILLDCIPCKDLLPIILQYIWEYRDALVDIKHILNTFHLSDFETAVEEITALWNAEWIQHTRKECDWLELSRIVRDIHGDERWWGNLYYIVKQSSQSVQHLAYESDDYNMVRYQRENDEFNKTRRWGESCMANLGKSWRKEALPQFFLYLTCHPEWHCPKFILARLFLCFYNGASLDTHLFHSMQVERLNTSAWVKSTTVNLQ